MPQSTNWKDDSHEEGLSPEDAPIDPQFETGQRVKLLETSHDRFKRRPEYAENAIGVINRVHGAYDVPTDDDDSAAYEYLYSVRFSHEEIWGEDHPESNGQINLDIWERTITSVDP